MHRILLALLCLLPIPALASEGKPKEIVALIRADVPYGKGEVSRLWIVGYEAELWTDANRWSMQRPFALSLIYRIPFTTEELVERIMEEMRRIPEAEEAMLERYPAKLRELLPNVKEGDRLTVVYMPGKSTSFYHNHMLTGTLTDDTFAEHFFAIWLGKNTSEPELREQLLKKR